MDHNAPEIYGHRISLVAFSATWVSDPSSEQQYCANDPGLCDVRLRLFIYRRPLEPPAFKTSSTMIPIYVAEFSPVLIRGRLVGLFEI